MKVNTDSVLLGAWRDVSAAGSILDIGTGSGVIALMMAQKNEHAFIDAIDIDAGAFEQAAENFKRSRWSNRLTAVHSPIQNYFPGKQYDIVVSNPPYFIDDHKNANHQKNIARHSVALDYETLVTSIARLLLHNGRTFISLPIFNLPVFETLAKRQKLYVVAVTEVTATLGKPPYLVLIELQQTEKPAVGNTVQIQHINGEFTAEYKALTKDFYLKF